MTPRTGVATRALVAAVAALVLLTGCTSLNSEQGGVATTIPRQLTPTPSATAAPPLDEAVPLYRATVPPTAPDPTGPARISVDWASIKASVTPVGTDSAGQMALPPDPADAGWYRYSAAPSASAGTTVLAAHVDAVGYGVGPFAHLVDVPKGTAITVTDTAGEATRYRIDSVSLLTKTAIPWRSIFTTTGPHRLVLVTCGGAFDYETHHYVSNLIVTATPT